MRYKAGLTCACMNRAVYIVCVRLTETGAFGGSTSPSAAQISPTMNQLQLQICPVTEWEY